MLLQDFARSGLIVGDVQRVYLAYSASTHFRRAPDRVPGCFVVYCTVVDRLVHA